VYYYSEGSMNNELSIAIVAGLGGMLGWGFADFFAKKTIDKIGDVTTLFWAQLIGVVPIAIIFFAKPEVPHLNHLDPLFLVLFGIVSAISYLPVYTAFGKGQVSILSPIFASYAALVAIWSALFFHEAIPDTRQLAIVIVFAGILAISADPRDIAKVLRKGSHSVRGLPEILAATVMYSFWLVLLDNFIHGRSWVFFLLIIRIFAALTLLIYSLIRHMSLSVKNRKLWKYLVLIGIFDVAAYAFVAYGFSRTSLTSVVALLSSCFSLPTMILAWIFLKEKITPLQTLAAFTIIVGVVLIAIS
jgi:drug/metabolite transporter (DMT)-like permease